MGLIFGLGFGGLRSPKIRGTILRSPHLRKLPYLGRVYNTIHTWICLSMIGVLWGEFRGFMRMIGATNEQQNQFSEHCCKEPPVTAQSRSHNKNSFPQVTAATCKLPDILET